MAESKIPGKWNRSKQVVNYRVPLIIFEEDNYVIVHCPALDLSGYGKSEESAKESFQIVLAEYLQYTTNKGTLGKDLESLGWKIHKKTYSPPSFQQSLDYNENFSNIFNTMELRKTNAEIALPAY